MPAFEASYFDGQSAQSHQVSVRTLPTGLEVARTDNSEKKLWPFNELAAVERYRRGQPLRLKLGKDHNARLIVPAGAEADSLINLAPHLTGKMSSDRVLRNAGIIAAVVAVIGLTGYGMIVLAPSHVAQAMPESWRNQLATQAERSLIKDTRQCRNRKGQYALNRLASRIGLAAEVPTDFSIRVFDMPMINAFALPGGRIVMTRKLIEAADRPAQVAGVLAHELGHVVYRHPEASLVRAMGLQLLVSIATGGSGGSDTLGSIASILAILSYSREAEVEADRYATDLMKRGGIDPLGLKEFFAQINKLEQKSGSETIRKYGRFFSTHPGTKERIEAIEPLPADQIKPVITDELWRDLKKICD